MQKPIYWLGLCLSLMTLLGVLTESTPFSSSKSESSLKGTHPKIANVSLMPSFTCKDTVVVILTDMGDAMLFPDSVVLSNMGADTLRFINSTGTTTIDVDSLELGCNDALVDQVIFMLGIDIDQNPVQMDTCQFILSVRDTFLPNVFIPDTMIQVGQAIPPPATNIMEFEGQNGMIMDNCREMTITVSSVDSTKMGVPGGIMRKYSITDLDSNITCFTQTLMFMDTIPPVIDCNGIDVNLSVDTLQTCGFEFAPDAPTATDLCGIDSIYTVLTGTTDPTSIYPVGTTELVWVAVDSCGLTDSCTVLITINDATPPNLEMLPDVTIDCTDDPTNLAITGDLLDFDDNCDLGGNTPQMIDDIMPGSCSSNYTIERVWSLMDTSGNVAFDTLIITVQDMTAPSLASSLDPMTPIKCYDDLPPFQNPSLDDDCSGTFLDTVRVVPPVVNLCLGYSIEYQYIANDSCGNSDTSSVFLQVLPDSDAPFFTSSLDTVRVDADSLGCEALVTLVQPTAMDSCSNVMVNDIPPAMYPIGENYVTWIATDACGNSTMAEQIIIVNDKTGPNIACRRDKIVNLTAPTANLLDAEEFIEGNPSDCNDTLTFAVRRMMDACRPDDLTFGSDVLFCCEDIDQNPMVILRATDGAGNFTECMVPVAVDDKLPPERVVDLPDIEVSCRYRFDDLNDLSAFGSIVYEEGDRETIDIDADVFLSASGPLTDGLVTDYCPGLTQVVTFEDNRTNGQGDIIRTFVITDQKGLTVTTTQTITVTLDDPLTLADIHFPADTTFNVASNCDNMPPSEMITGEPTFDFTGFCTMPAVFKKDKIFDDPNSGCAVIQREWTVIDMAQFTPNSGTGKWTDLQYIFLENTVAPVFDFVQGDTLVGNLTGSCDARLQLTTSATDDCTMFGDVVYRYKIDIDNNGSDDIIGDGNVIDEVLPQGVHKVKWLSEDRCGNVAINEFLVEAKETKAPTPVCINGLSLDLTDDLTGEIWASDFNRGSSDNCTAQEDLIISFDANSLMPNMSFDCDDLGVVNVRMYVTDEVGNQSFCNSFITITDNFVTTAGDTIQCPNSGTNTNNPMVRISGRISTEDAVAVPEAMVKISGVELRAEQMTEESGLFLFDSLEMYKTYDISPVKDNGFMEGVSTLDLILIQRHILKITEIDSPYKLIAADVTGDEKITANDITQLRRLILGVSDRFKSNQSWRFVDKGHVFPDPGHPWPFNENNQYSDLDIDMMSSDFVAVKVGDVDNSVSSTFKPNEGVVFRGLQTFTLAIEDKVFEEGEEVIVRIPTTNDLELLGLQMSLEYDADALMFNELESDQLEVGTQEFALTGNDVGNFINLAYSDINPVDLRKGDNLINLKFIAKKAGKLSNVLSLNPSVIDAVAYDVEGRSNHIVMDFSETRSVIELLGNEPNPFTSHTTVKFALSEDMPVELSILDNLGRKIYSDYSFYKAGTQRVFISSKQLGNAKGVFYLHLESAEKREILKLLRIN